MPRLQGKIAIVTGSSSGIGRAIALKLSSEGCVVICGDLQETARKEKDAETAIATHSLIAQRAGTADFLAVDVSKAEDVEKLVAYAVEKYSRLDMCVHLCLHCPCSVR
jgi:NAD(P)-dependent dehydrogenase (short-subunit alcohol dehydrogenase family)